MERDLNEREKAGVPDAVLLEHYEDENVFIENLEKRFKENIIYVRRKLLTLKWTCVMSLSRKFHFRYRNFFAEFRE